MYVTKEPIFFLWLETFGVRAVDVLGNRIVGRWMLLCTVS